MRAKGASRTATVVSVFVTLIVLVATLPLRASAAPPPVVASGSNGQAIISVNGSLGGVTTSPLPMTPGFSPSTTDYAIWCASGINLLQFTLIAASGTLTYGSTTDSRINVQVALGENQAAVIEMNGEQASAGYWIRCLPNDFPRIAISKPGSPTAGYNLTGNLTGPAPSYAMVLNQNGTPVWYQKAAAGVINMTLLANQTLAWAPNLGPGLGATPGGGYTTYNLSSQSLGKIVPPIGPADPHELQQLPNGNYVMIASPLLSGVDLSSIPNPSLASYNTIVDCIVEEFTQAGSVVWSWDAYKDGRILPDESQDAFTVGYNGTTAVDMYHCNSVDVSPSGTNVLISSRHVGALFDVAMGGANDKHVLWKLGGNNKVPTYAAGPAAHIVPTGDPEGTFSGQHDARILTTDTNDVPTEVSLYDDHSFSGDVGYLPGGARGVEYSVNPAANSSAYVIEYPNGGNTTTAGATGSFRVYSGGADNLVGWGFRSQGSGFTEYDQSGNILMDQSFPDGEQNFRAIKVPLAALDLNLLRASAGLLSGTPPNPTWSQVPNGVLTSGPALTSWTQTRYDLFGRGTDGALWHAFWTGSGWSGWESLGGQIEPGTSRAAVAWANNRIDVFIEGTDQQMWHIWWAGSGWSYWEPLGGVLSSGPAVASWSSGRLDVVAAGVDGGVYHKWFDGFQWNGWEALGGTTDFAPGIAAWGTGRLDVFVDGTDGQLYHDWFTGGGWAYWEARGGALTEGPAAASIASGELDAVAPGADGLLERLQFTGTWQAWQVFNSEKQTSYSPALVSLLNGTREEVCVTDGSGLPQCGGFNAVTPPSAQAPAGATISPGAAKQLG